MSSPEAGKAVVGSFLRRFSRLSAKTRSKYRNELRRSNSLLDLRSNSELRSQSEATIDQSDQSNNLLSEWIGRRLRTRHRDTVESRPAGSTVTSGSLPETYVGNTLLKEKPRLRVRNCDKSATIATSSDKQRLIAADYDPNRAKHKTLPALNSSSNCSELSDMEQVLFRAARLRSRRVRSASNETRSQTHSERTSQEYHFKRF